MTPLDRFHACMNYSPVDRVPNHEVGVWTQTKQRWREEGLAADELHWDWFVGEARWDLDPREYIDVGTGMVPGFEVQVISREGETEIIRGANGVTTKALITGTVDGMRASMDEFIGFPVSTPADFQDLKRRFRPSSPVRYPAYWQQFQLPGWGLRQHPLILGRNCSILGYYWRAREWMGTENLSYAWYDEPAMMHEMMEFITDFTIEVTRPFLAAGVKPDYVFINEDLSMKNGPLLSPDCYRTFILPELKKLVAWFKSQGVRWVVIDTDGNCELVIPPFMEAGVDAIWPLERASDMDPRDIRKKFGRDLRLWGGVDKRELAKDPAAIDAHLRTFQPLIAEGGFIPSVDHLVPPDVSLANFEHYMRRKHQLLRGEAF
ncbi:MAG: uroporphyrinogen decarboxylase [Verrucomicrobia bacterium]|jgi:Uroporphyrinogen decarboxylase (URO-D)|nr:MAG: uroporphyrinogen decarboxylase [Verrucomicrobiota bacterium]